MTNEIKPKNETGLGIKDMGIEFLQEPFVIPEERKIDIYRFNAGDESPFINNMFGMGLNEQKWQKEARSIRTANPAGIYGLTIDHILCGLSDYILTTFRGVPNVEGLTFLHLEIDRKDVLFQSAQEISFSRANIIEQITPKEFANRFPDYKDIVLFYDQFKKSGSHIDGSMAVSFITSKEQVYNFGQKWLNPSNARYIHGITHSARVERFGAILTKHTSANINVIRAFAYFHDLGRLNDGSDIEHGKRSEEIVRRERKGMLLNNLTDDEIEQLCFACRNHTTMLRSDNITISTCFDADRLDLPRVGTKPLPERMATDIGAYFAANMELFNVISHVFTHI